jgi:GxxExxY protein
MIEPLDDILNSMTDQSDDPLTRRIIGAAIEVHRALGPGLLESVYEECLAVELSERGLSFERQVPLPVLFKGRRVEAGYRLDLLVEKAVVVEVKTVDRFAPIHDAQLLTYIRLANVRRGLLLNFHSAYLRDGIRRKVL